MDPLPEASPIPRKFIPAGLPMYCCPWPVQFNFPMMMSAPAETSPDQGRKYKRTWSRDQVEELYAAAKSYCTLHNKALDQLDLADFTEISSSLCRSPRKCMNKIREIQISGTLRSGVWGPDEDKVLKHMLTEGKKKWGLIADAINQTFHKGLKVRTGKQCKERWNNHINPLIDRGEWTPLDDLKLLECHKRLGNRWSVIAKELKSRTDSSIKNRIKSLLNREKQNVVGGGSADLLDSLIAKKQQEVMELSDQDPASPASHPQKAESATLTFSSASAGFQIVDV